MELFKYIYFYEQKSIIKAGSNKFQDLINAPRIFVAGSLFGFCTGVMTWTTET